MAIVVYKKPSCRQCKQTIQALDRKGLDYELIDISEDENALAFVKDLGYLQAPVIVTDENHWSGYDPDKIDEYYERTVTAEIKIIEEVAA